MRTTRTVTILGVSVPGGVWPGGCLTRGGCVCPGGVWPRGVSDPGGVSDLGGVWLGGVWPGGVSDLGGVWPGGVSDQGWGVSDPGGVWPGGCTMWPIPSCIWCYLYAASTPTETHQQCTCLYTAAWSCDLQGMLGYPPPPVNRMTDRCKIITLPQTSFAGGKNVMYIIKNSELFKHKHISSTEN